MESGGFIAELSVLGNFGIKGFDADTEPLGFRLTATIVVGSGELGESREAVLIRKSEVFLVLLLLVLRPRSFFRAGKKPRLDGLGKWCGVGSLRFVVAVFRSGEGLDFEQIGRASCRERV